MGDRRHILFGRSKKGGCNGGARCTYGGERIREEGFGGKPERERPLGKPRHGWKDNTAVDFKEIRKIAKVDY
jgi:hypothetical protein